MGLGDDDRRKKSKRHREAAFSRYEDRADRASRRSKEGVVDLLNAIVHLAVAVVKLPFSLFGALHKKSSGRSKGKRMRFRRRD